MPHNNDVNIVVKCTRDQHAKIKAAAVKNCRTMGNECLFRVMTSIESEAVG